MKNQNTNYQLNKTNRQKNKDESCKIEELRDGQGPASTTEGPGVQAAVTVDCGGKRA